MAKGQKRGNREARKPKKDKPPMAASASSFAANFTKPIGAKPSGKKA